MKGQSLLSIAIVVVVFSAVSDSLAIGFEVDTPLDPFLGSISKIKRHLVRRIKDFGTDENFLNSSPVDQIGMLLGQQPGLFTPFPVQSPQLTAQPPVANQLSLPVYDQRKSNVNQIPVQLLQQLDAQLAQLGLPIANGQFGKRVTAFPSSFGLRQLPGPGQQFTQTLPGQAYPQFSVNLRQRFV